MENLFTIGKNDKCFSEFRFAAMVLNKKSNHIFKRVLKVDQDSVTGTDGCRVHTAKTVSCEVKGFFEVVQNTKSLMTLKQVDDINYPDCGPIFEYDTKAILLKPMMLNRMTKIILQCYYIVLIIIQLLSILHMLKI